MKKQILAVCDAEEEYVRCFCKYTDEKEGYPFAAAAFTSLECLLEFCRTKKVDVLLISAELYVPALEKEPALPEQLCSQILVLQEEDTVKETELYKYQSCEVILKEVLLRFGGELPENRQMPARHGQLQLIGLYTPVHRSLQTTFAMTLGEILAKDHKVLYLNFESFSGFEKRLEREFVTDMSDLIYYVSNAREALFYKLGGMTQQLQRLYYIPPVFSCMDLARITPKQWKELFLELERLTDYEYIILDLSDSMQGLFDILHMCTRIFTLEREDGAAASKLYQYERLLERMDESTILQKTKKYRLPYIKNLPFSPEMLTYGELADYVRQIVKDDIYGG